MNVSFLNWRGPQGRETIDEIRREDYPVGRDGAKAYRDEKARLLGEYAMAGMGGAYWSSRQCANWKEST